MKLTHLNHQQGMSLAALAIIALAIPLGVIAVRQPQILSSLASTSAPADPARPAQRCVVTGCQNHLCVDAAYQPVQTDCRPDPGTTCFANATCTLQADGGCGFVITDEIDTCLQQTNSQLNNPPRYITQTTLPTATVDQTYQANLNLTNLTNTTNNLITVSNLPEGLTYSCTSSSCTLTGSATTAGRHLISVAYYQDNTLQDHQLLALTVRKGGTLKRSN